MPSVPTVGIVEEGEAAQAGAVEDLVWHHDIARRHLLLQAAAGADRDQILHAQLLEAPDVGPAVEARGADAVAAAVAAQKGHALALQGSHDVGVRRRAKGGFQPDLFYLLQGAQLVDAAAADHSDAHRFHDLPAPFE
jgi:hypothetical protein